MDHFEIALIISFIVLLIVIFYQLIKRGMITIEPAHKRAGRRGEEMAAKLIDSVLKEGDIHLKNVAVTYDGKEAEFDNIIINSFGVFIIEVKNYSGRLFGSEDDYEWEKVHISDAGNRYIKTVKNPIKQVKREVYILAKYLGYYGVSVWVKGYTMILGASSPVKSEYVLSGVADIDRAIHTPERKRYNKATVNKAVELLS